MPNKTPAIEVEKQEYLFTVTLFSQFYDFQQLN